MKSLSLALLLTRPGGLPPLPVPLAAPALSLTPALPAPALNMFWDGAVAQPHFIEPVAPAYAPAAPLGYSDEGDGGRLAPWLESGDDETDAALDRAVALARETPSGRRALDLAEALLLREKRTVPVSVGDLGGNWGEYDYVDRRMSLHKKLLAPGREAELAGTLVHELVHVVQHEEGIPSNALEMEIEAHLTDLAMLAELGLEPPKGTFAAKLKEALAESPRAFTDLLSSALGSTVYLGDMSIDDAVDSLEEDLEALRKKKGKSSAKLALVVERDFDLLRTPEGAAAYRRFSKRVRALLLRTSHSARSGPPSSAGRPS